MKLLQPKLWVDHLQDIPLKQLKTVGIKGLIVDIDNTLVAWDAEEPSHLVREWIAEAKNLGFQVVLVSNNKTPRVEKMQAYFMCRGLSRAKKPTTGALKKAMRLMKLNRSQIAIIGDQIFTDVLGGNRIGIYTILVSPIKSKEFWWTQLVRPVEERVLRKLKKFHRLVITEEDPAEQEK